MEKKYSESQLQSKIDEFKLKTFTILGIILCVLLCILSTYGKMKEDKAHEDKLDRIERLLDSLEQN